MPAPVACHAWQGSSVVSTQSRWNIARFERMGLQWQAGERASRADTVHVIASGALTFRPVCWAEASGAIHRSRLFGPHASPWTRRAKGLTVTRGIAKPCLPDSKS